jgi:opacity protein-like surface antigen
MFRFVMAVLVLATCCTEGTLLGQTDCASSADCSLDRWSCPDWQRADVACDVNTCCETCGFHYFGIFGGASDVDNFEREFASGSNKRIDGAKLRDSWAGGATVGRRWHPHSRGEFEFTFRDASVARWFDQTFNSSGALSMSSTTAATGSVQSYSGMFNILFDLEERTIGRPNLYLGGGLGSLYVDADVATAANAYEAHDTSFAYQFIAGLAFPIGQPWDFFAEYRYLGADYIGVDNLTTGQGLGDFGYDSHNVFIGVRVGR